MLPLICACPDNLVIRKTGELLVCAGAMADYYKKRWFSYQYGKPFLETYQLCVDHLNQENKVLKSNILCIGDSLETDIRANQFGKSLFIANGIHKNELHINNSLISKINIKKF